ncbi:MAG: type 4a pilus biogenesis protein PilO [bacterium]|nr:type 4a pilus biogenesis protein PilO [bacterium]
MARIITSLIFLAAAVMVFFAWTKPNFAEVGKLQKKEAAFNEILGNSKRLQTVRDEILSEYNSISQDDLDKLNKILPSKMEAIKLIIEIESIAKSHGLILKNIDVKKGKEESDASFGPKKEDFGEVSMAMSVAGRYGSFVSFLKDLERNSSLIDIDRITFISSDTDSYEFNVGAVTYWKKQK